MTKLLILVLLGFLFPSLALNLFYFQKSKNNSEGIAVIGVIDGDTLVLEGKTRLRLRSIDAPESEYCGGVEAKKELEKLVLNKKVIIKEKIMDQVGRPMALVYADNFLINQKMLETGWVRFHSDATSARNILKQTYDNIRAKEIGIYSSKCRQMENPDNPKCNIKGNLDKNSDSRLYYFPGCVQYNTTVVEKDLGEQWFCTEKEAQKAGFSKSVRCPL